MSSTATQPRLLLKHEDLRKNTAKLFESLKSDRRAQLKFASDPVGVLSSRVLKKRLPPQRISDSNRVLFAMMANTRFRKWLDAYPVRPRGKRVTEQKFARDFVSAVARFGDADLIGAIFKAQVSGAVIFTPGEVFEQLVTGPEKSVITSPATPSTSDKSANSSQNFNNKQSGFEFGGDLVDPVLMRSVMSLLLQRAKALSASGKLANPSANIR